MVFSMNYKIAVIPGDGIGPEVINEGVKVLKAAQKITPGLTLQFISCKAGADCYQETGIPFPKEAYQACLEADAIYLGAVGYPDVLMPDGTEISGEVVLKLRFDLDLYAGVRPIKLYPGVDSLLRNRQAGDIDYVILRENTEGLYASRGSGTLLRGEVATDTLVVTRKGTERIIRYGFELAKKRKGAPQDRKKRVTCVDKANVLRSYAFFRQIYEEVAGGYGDIEQDYAYIDAMALWMNQIPEYYDVVVTENMFGDILSDLAASTVGGMGMAPSGDIGDRHAVFQPSHGTAPTIAGKGIANPIATILSGSMMLEWLGSRHQDAQACEAARKVEDAVTQVLAEGKIRTPDIGGSAKTSEVGDAMVEKLVIT
jgi:3-isopropylmalate dehydrogenase